jgi:succinyl-diaminopimelate desuccinylase
VKAVNDSQVLAEQTLALCAIPSVIGEERLLTDRLESWAANYFVPDERFRHSHSLVLGRRNDPRPSLALVGHVDTVPVPAGGFPNPRQEGDRLFGLGSSDMKGGIAVMMRLVETLPRANLPYNLLLVLYEGEEGPYLDNGLEPLFDRVPELSQLSFAVALEPTDGEVQVGCVGSLHATIRFRGQAAHSARPWQGLNAVHAAGPLLAKLLARPPHEVEQAGFCFREVMSITRAQGGRARNVIPDLFELNLNYRFAPGKDLATAEAEVHAAVGPEAQVEFTDRAPSGRVCADHPLFRHLVEVSERPAAPKQAWTDVARFNQRGVDGVNFGPGETAQAHQESESASVSALGRAYGQLSRFLRTAPRR